MSENKEQYFTKSVEVIGHRCSHCGLMSFSSEEKKCPGCGNPFDKTDEMSYSEDGIVYKNPEQIEKLTSFELWECDSCGTINSNKPKNYNKNNEIDCAGCGKNFDINNWIKPFWQFNELTFSDENNYEVEFRKKYFEAFELARKNRDLENFYSEYKQLHKNLVSENIFDREDEVRDLYNYLLNYIKKNSFEEVKDDLLEHKDKVTEILIKLKENNPLEGKNKKTIGVAAILVLGLYFGITTDYEKIKIDKHSWQILTPKDVFKYKRFEIFNRQGTNDFKIYIERKKDPKLQLVDLGYGEMGNGTYHTENDGTKKQRNIPGTCSWTYTYVDKVVDDHSRPIKEERTKQECHTKYKTVIKEDCRIVSRGDRKETICRNVRERVSDGQSCKPVTEYLTIGYKQKTIKEKIRDKEICQKEWYQPTKQVENKEETIVYKAKQWQSDGYHISSGEGLNLHIIYSSKVNEKIYENRSKINYFLNYTIYTEKGPKQDEVKITNKSDWKSIKNGTECKVKVYKILGISLGTDNNSILEKCR